MKLWRVVVLTTLLYSSAFGADEVEAQAAYCRYVSEQAAAERDLLRSPSATMGPVQPSIGSAPQLLLGITNSLADDKKAYLTMKAARSLCELHSAGTEVEMHIRYALVGIEKDALNNRLGLIRRAREKLNEMAAENATLIASQNLTRPAAYYLELARVRLDTSSVAAQQTIASLYLPAFSKVPLRTLISHKMTAEEVNQKATTSLAKVNGWDIKMSVGARRQLADFTPNTSRMGAFGEFALTYNLGNHAADRHYDRSVTAYLEWKLRDPDDASRQASILKKQIAEQIEIVQAQLRLLAAHDSAIETQLRAVDGLDTSNALSFRTQLVADQSILGVDLGDAQFRLAQLRQYIDENF